MVNPWAEFEFSLAGEYNVLNATAAAAMAADYGIADGSDRRGAAQIPQREAPPGSEGRGSRHYYHRRLRAPPDRDPRTLKAVRTRYPGRRLWAILEPRSNTLRRKVFQAELAQSLGAWPTRSCLADVFKSEAIPERERLDRQQWSPI